MSGFSALSAAAPVTGSLKVWGRQLSLDSASDWSGGRRPCPGQVALLGDNLAVRGALRAGEQAGYAVAYGYVGEKDVVTGTQ